MLPTVTSFKLANFFVELLLTLQLGISENPFLTYLRKIKNFSMSLAFKAIIESRVA